MKTALATLALPLLVLAGCTGPAKVIVNAAPAALAQCTRFGWDALEGQPASLLDQQVRNEALTVLAAKGYAIDDVDPDCRVGYAASDRARSRATPSVGIGAGGGSGHFGAGVGISLPVGGGSKVTTTLSIDIISVAQNAQIWNGTLDRALSPGNPSPEQVREAVQKILAEFPAR